MGAIFLVVGLFGIYQAFPLYIQEQGFLGFLDFLIWLIGEGVITYIFSTVVGDLCLGLGLFVSGRYILRRRTVGYLKSHGEIIHGEVSEIYKDPLTRVQGENPWRIAVEWMNPDSGKAHTFESDQIWYNPSDFTKIGDKIEVRIDPKNPKKHWVNTNHLRERAD